MKQALQKALFRSVHTSSVALQHCFVTPGGLEGADAYPVVVRPLRHAR